MATEEPIIGGDAPRRRPGPHAPLPTGTAQPAQPAQQALNQQALTQQTPREETSMERAARRTEELRAHLGDDADGQDKFHIDPRMIPDGWSYEWKVHAVLGKPNPSYEVTLAYKGWEAVPASRHPEMMPENWQGACIERDGQVLMERPLTITEDAKRKELEKARAQVRQKEVQLSGAPAGNNSPFANNNKGAPLVNINKSHEPFQFVPKE